MQVRMYGRGRGGRNVDSSGGIGHARAVTNQFGNTTLPIFHIVWYKTMFTGENLVFVGTIAC